MALIADQQAKLEAKKQESAALGKQITMVGEQLGAAKEHRSGLISRQNLLKDLEAKREGVSEGVKSVLRQRETKFGFIRGLVADVLRVDVEHAHVIEASLDGRDQWLVTNDQSLAIAADEALNDLEGRVNVLCVDRLFGAQRGMGVSPMRSSRSDRTTRKTTPRKRMGETPMPRRRTTGTNIPIASALPRTSSKSTHRMQASSNICSGKR